MFPSEPPRQGEAPGLRSHTRSRGADAGTPPQKAQGSLCDTWRLDTCCHHLLAGGTPCCQAMDGPAPDPPHLISQVGEPPGGQALQVTGTGRLCARLPGSGPVPPTPPPSSQTLGQALCAKWTHLRCGDWTQKEDGLGKSGWWAHGHQACSGCASQRLERGRLYRPPSAPGHTLHVPSPSVSAQEGPPASAGPGSTHQPHFQGVGFRLDELGDTAQPIAAGLLLPSPHAVHAGP